MLIPTIAEIFKASVFDIWSKPEVEKFCDFSEFMFNIFEVDLSSMFLLFDRFLYYNRFKPLLLSKQDDPTIEKTLLPLKTHYKTKINLKVDPKNIDFPTIYLEKLTKYLKSVVSNFRDFKNFQLSNFRHTRDLPPLNHAITAMPMLDMMVILKKKTRQFLNPLWLECYLQMLYVKYIIQYNFLGIDNWQKELFGLVSKIGLQYWRRLYKSNYLNIEASNCLNTFDDGEEAADFGLIVQRPHAFEGFIGSLVEALKNFREIQLPVIVDCL
jgi:hypothetical protein